MDERERGREMDGGHTAYRGHTAVAEGTFRCRPRCLSASPGLPDIFLNPKNTATHNVQSRSETRQGHLDRGRLTSAHHDGVWRSSLAKGWRRLHAAEVFQGSEHLVVPRRGASEIQGGVGKWSSGCIVMVNVGVWFGNQPRRRILSHCRGRLVIFAQRGACRARGEGHK